MTALGRAIEEFRKAQREHGRDLHDTEKAEALRRARLALDQRAREVLHRFPFGIYPVTRDCHYALREPADLREGRRHKGQTLCGAPSGYPPRGRPAPCPACLLVAERYLVEGPPPLELELGL